VNTTSLKARFLLIGFLFVIVAKFWLVWESEIFDASDDPHEYILQILYPANGGLAYPPGTGLVGQAFHGLGVPFRLGLEITFLVAGVLTIRALFAWPWKSSLALGLYSLFIFDPAVVDLFTHIFSDDVWLIETLLGLACFALSIETGLKPHWGRLSLAVLFLGLATITRSALIPTLVSILLFTLVSMILVLSKFRARTLKPQLDLMALSLPSLIFGISLIYGGTCVYDFSHHGYTGISYLDSDQYKRFYLCLQSVGEPTGDPHFPIDENRRKLIAQAGPDSKWFIRQIEANSTYKQAGLDHYGKDDIPAGWFHWASFTAAMDPATGDYLHAFSLFHSIEDEIAAADKLGIVKVRPIVSLPDSRIAIVMATFPNGLSNAFKETLHEPSSGSFASLSDMRTHLYRSPEFTTALTRRAVTASPLRSSIWQGMASLYAWTYTPVAFVFYVLTLIVCAATLILKWKQLSDFPPSLVAPLFFTVFFVVFFFWYALFDASGMPVLSRYMILNHLLLVPLLCRYVTMTVSLRRAEPTL